MSRNSYAGDPRWINAKYAGIDAKGTAFKAGDRIFYFPNGKRIYAGTAADDAARQFEADRFDEDGY